MIQISIDIACDKKAKAVVSILEQAGMTSCKTDLAIMSELALTVEQYVEAQKVVSDIARDIGKRALKG